MVSENGLIFVDTLKLWKILQLVKNVPIIHILPIANLLLKLNIALTNIMQNFAADRVRYLANYGQFSESFCVFCIAM